MSASKVVVVSLACGILVAATLARAQTVTMNFISADGNQSGGFYTYPYYFTINSGTNVFSLMCDTFTHEISNGESWSATILSVANLTSNNVQGLEFGSLGVTTYLEACYLYQEELAADTPPNDTDPSGLYNWAVWDLFTQSDPSSGALNNPTEESTVQGYLSDAEAQGPSLTLADFPGMYIITPTNMASDGPQEFFGVCTVPEPGTLALVAFSLGGLVLIRKRA